MFIFLVIINFGLKLLAQDTDYLITSIKTKPKNIAVPVNFLQILNLEINKETSLKDMAKGQWENLTKEDLDLLYKLLSKTKINIKFSDQNDMANKHCGYCYFKANAALALALYWHELKNNENLTSLIATAPLKILPFLKNKGKKIVNNSIIDQAIIYILSNEKEIDSSDVIKKISLMIKSYIELNSTNKKEKFNDLLSGLLTLILDNNYNFSNKEKGIILGSILSGAILYVNEIQDQYDQSLWIVNSITNIAWAASTFIGALPLASAISSIIAGGFSLSVVLIDVIFNRLGKGDLGSLIKEIEGQVEINLLNICENQSQDKKIDILEILAWIKASLHTNGLTD